MRKTHFEVWTQTHAIDNLVPSRAINFDPFEEILWSGVANGKITSYLGAGMDKFCSFYAYKKEPIHQLLVESDVIYSLSSTQMKCHSRGGISINSVSQGDIPQLSSFSFTDYQKSKIVMVGEAKVVLTYDVQSGSLDKFDVESDVGVVKSGKNVYCGHLNGKIGIYDPRNSFKMEHSFEAHSGNISDIDVKENLMVTCGFTARNGNLVCDPLVKVFDLRMNRLLSQTHFNYGPTYLKFNPRFSSQVCVVSQTGYYQFKDVGGEQNTSIAYQLETRGQAIQGFDISSCGEVLAFSDANGYVHLWNMSQQYFHINNYSVETEMPMTPRDPKEYDGFDFTAFPLSEEPTDELLSNWPPKELYVISQVHHNVHPQILNTMKIKQNYLYCPNPGLETVKDGYVMNNEQEDLKVVPDTFDKIFVSDLEEKKAKFEKINFAKYNSTKWVGFANNVEDSYMNCFFQMMYHIKPLRIALINHQCDREICAACEFGFLFHTMKQKQGGDDKNINAYNLLRTIRHLKESRGRGIYEGDNSFIHNISDRIHALNNFLLLQLNKEMFQDVHSIVNVNYLDKFMFKKTFTQSSLQHTSVHHSKKLNLIEMLFSSQLSIESSCSSCHQKNTKDLIQLSFDAVESTPINLLFSSERGKACPSCRKFKSCVENKTCFDLPNILNINLHSKWKELPQYIMISLEKVKWKVESSNTIDQVSKSSPKATFELSHIISHVKNPLGDKKGHLISSIRKKDKWVTFNDFQIVVEDTFRIKPWKTPVILYYSRLEIKELLPKLSVKNQIPASVFLNVKIPKGLDQTFKSLTNSHLPKKGDIVGIDAEFISLQNSSILSLGRVSVLRDGDDLPFLDDYISTSEEVYDYLTRFSGLQLGDLDPTKSRYFCTNLKATYLKLRYLVDNGVCFVGHGLENDFKICGLFVPKEQIIDTVEIYHLPNQRKISLRFLCVYCLGKDIQVDTHDSVIDAKVSLELFHYSKNMESGHFDIVLHEIYEVGRLTNWDVEVLKTLKK
jgi:PAB-dependent poly(A)-specific ribonuclease subunit 2